MRSMDMLYFLFSDVHVYSLEVKHHRTSAPQNQRTDDQRPTHMVQKKVGRRRHDNERQAGRQCDV